MGPMPAEALKPTNRRQPDLLPSVIHHERVMGTVFTFDIRYPGAGERAPEGLGLHLARARALLHRIDAVFSLWKPSSPMCRLRRGEIELAAAPREVSTVLQLCEEARKLTEGWFDATLLPGGIDPTGLVKGWAAGRALDLLVDAGFSDVLINAAGDVVASGSPGGSGLAPEHAGPPWRIGIRDPRRDREGLVAVATIGSGVLDGTPRSPLGSIATSGTYERGAHLFDPRSRRHRCRFASASVSGPESWLADAAATALAVAGPDGYSFIESLQGYEALTVGFDGTVRATPRFALAKPEQNQLRPG